MSLAELRGPAQVQEVVRDAVHVARGFHLGNVIKVATAEGPLVIDTTGGTANGAAARDALAEASPGDPAYVVYTHCHNDHTSGAEAFTAGEATRDIVAQALLPEIEHRDMTCLANFTQRHRSFQMGRPGEAVFEHRTFLPPTLTFDESLDIELGGLTFHLEHTEGETRDHLLVWIPELRVLCPGDLVYASFPNLSTPAVGPRPILGWIRALDRFIELEPEHLVGSHSGPVSGRGEVAAVLTAYRDAIQHVWDESVRAIDAGVEVHEAARTIALPPELASHPWLREIYGTVNWGVRAVYDVLTGWHDLEPASLNPHPEQVRDRALVEAAGAGAIVERAAQALGAGDAQLAVELLEVVLHADPLHVRANEVQAEACVALRRSSTSINEMGFYRSGEVVARKRLEQAGA